MSRGIMKHLEFDFSQIKYQYTFLDYPNAYYKEKENMDLIFLNPIIQNQMVNFNEFLECKTSRALCKQIFNNPNFDELDFGVLDISQKPTQHFKLLIEVPKF